MALIKHHMFFILGGCIWGGDFGPFSWEQEGGRLGADGSRASNGILQQMAAVRAMQTVELAVGVWGCRVTDAMFLPTGTLHYTSISYPTPLTYSLTHSTHIEQFHRHAL